MPSGTPPAHGLGEILLIDDSPSSLLLLSTLLVNSGYRVREATSGELALWTVQSKAPDLILLDLRMPGMSGLEVCRCLKADPATRPIPVIFLSSQDDSNDKVLGLEIGAVDFINKNSSHEEILARINTHIALAKITKDLETERAELEQRVEERTGQIVRSTNLLRQVIDSSPDWIYALDRQYRFLLVNHKLAAVRGGSPERLLGEYDCSLFHHGDDCHVQGQSPCAYHQDEDSVFAGTSVFKAQEQLTLKNGRQLLFETYMTPLRDPDGAIYALLCYRRDIAPRLAIEAQTRRLEAQLWQAKKMAAIGQLAGGIAHDFNHLLSLILGFSQFAETALANGKTDKLPGYLGEISKAGTAAQELVAQLLAFSRTDEMASEAIPILPIIVSTIESLRPTLEAGITLELQTDASSPVAQIKAGQVKQVLTNLILNACDAFPLRRGRIDIDCRTARQVETRHCASCRQNFAGDYLKITVSDNGCGIPEPLLERIFEPFFTSKDVGKGSGLGLAIVHGIVHTAGGHVSIDSTPGQGSQFAIWLPLHADLQEANPLPSPA